MQAEEIKIEYAPRATYGSVAYDLNAIPAYDEPELDGAPVREKAKSHAKAKNVQGLSLVGMMSFAAAAVLAVFILLANLQLTVVSSEASELQSQLEELQNQERMLRIRYESAIDLNEIDQYATSVLGMVKANETQINLENAAGEDRAEILIDDAGKNSAWSEFRTFMSSLLEYFKK